MSLCHQIKPRDPSPSGKIEHVSVPGVQYFSPVTHHEFTFSVGRRSVGLTVKRVQYSVSIQEGEGETIKFLDNFPSMLTAQQAARKWIETNRIRPHTKSVQTKSQRTSALKRLALLRKQPGRRG